MNHQQIANAPIKKQMGKGRKNKKLKRTGGRNYIFSYLFLQTKPAYQGAIDYDRQRSVTDTPTNRMYAPD